jgi:hypothetical protein
VAEAEQWAEKRAGEFSGSCGPQKELELLFQARIWLALGKNSQAASLLTMQSFGKSYGHTSLDANAQRR